MTIQERDDFLIEIGTEELPPKTLLKLGQLLANNIEQELVIAKLSFEKINFFATPRRLAIKVDNLTKQQLDYVVERVGPNIDIAYDKAGQPTPAALGFAKSCGVLITEVGTKETPKGKCLYYQQTHSGATIFDLAPTLINKALQQLPIPKPMLWGQHLHPFIRPVHWLVIMFGPEVISGNLFDLSSNNKSYGHRFHAPGEIIINHPNEFEQLLEKNYVISDFHKRRELIRTQITKIAALMGQVIIDEDLLEEVTSLVEWPVALLGQFDPRFLQIPPEVLISSMKTHQKCFPLINDQGHLLPYFITVANIESHDPNEVITGNERVIRARLTDAEFFYQTDLKQSLDHSLERLKMVIFQKQLGSLFEKAVRISALAEFISIQIGANPSESKRAGLLSKADLSSEMTGEFPELQGIMGYYYALQNKESPEVAEAIKEHYLPKFAKDSLPKSQIGTLVALADKLDTLIGLFGINQPPTGEKDPFALRRAALGVLRLLIENQLNLDLRVLLHTAKSGYANLTNDNAVENTLAFILERLRAWYEEQGITPDLYASIFARYPTSPYEFDQRIKAIQFFQSLPEAKSLASANKRVSNILKETDLSANIQYERGLLKLNAEKELANMIEQQRETITELCKKLDYKSALKLLANFQKPIDQFFDQVMVMVDDEQLKNNRLLLLRDLQQLFLQIADFSLLHQNY